MSNILRGLAAWSRPITPPTLVIEIEKGLPVANHGDEQAIASLQMHPGYLALINRFKLKKAFLENQLRSVRHKDIRDVDIIQSSISGFGLMEYEVNQASGNLKNKNARLATPYEINEFEEARLSIESIRATNSE